MQQYALCRFKWTSLQNNVLCTDIIEVNTIVWNVISCSLVGVYGCFGRMLESNICNKQRAEWYFFQSSELVVNFYLNTWHHIPENNCLHT
jgi:hypothetical protein